jgi:hypothetical protein
MTTMSSLMTGTGTMPHGEFDSPNLNVVELRWAAEEVAALLQHVEPSSAVAAVLQQTVRELASLKQSAEAMVLGPIRLRRAA